MKNLLLSAFLAGALAVAFTGCSSKAKTVKYWENQPINKLEEALDKCNKADELSATESESCNNAKEAYRNFQMKVMEKPASKTDDGMGKNAMPESKK